MSSYTKYHRKYEQKHREEINARKRAWREKNRDRINAYQRERRKKINHK